MTAIGAFLVFPVTDSQTHREPEHHAPDVAMLPNLTVRGMAAYRVMVLEQAVSGDTSSLAEPRHGEERVNSVSR